MKLDSEKMKSEPGNHWTYINPANEGAMQEILKRHKEWAESRPGANRRKIQYQDAVKQDKIPFYMSSWLFGLILRGEISDNDADWLMNACVEEIEDPVDRNICVAGMRILSGGR